MQLNFDWDTQKARTNFKKHGVSFKEATEVFADPLAMTLFDSQDHSTTEERWVTLGKTKQRYLVVVIHTWREQNNQVYVRIISARNADSDEVKRYQEGAFYA